MLDREKIYEIRRIVNEMLGDNEPTDEELMKEPDSEALFLLYSTLHNLKCDLDGVL